MEDYFATLGLRQALVLDDAQLKDAWHQAAAAASDAEEIHRAYSALRDPARRIGHLLERHGRTPAGAETPGARLFDLFFTVAAVLKNADAIVTQIESAASALQRAGQTPRLLTSLDDLTSAGAAVAAEKATRDTQLTSLAEKFPHMSNAEWDLLTSLGSDFAFLTKWAAEIQKRETRLQETLMGKIV